MDTTRTVDRDGLASAMSWLLAGTAVIVLDARIGTADVLFDPVGGMVVAVGVERVVRATGATQWSGLLRLAAWLHAALLLAVEVGVLSGALAVGGAGLADATEATGPWAGVAFAATTSTSVGLVLLGLHLHRSLTGVAADRWRQVGFAWAAELVLFLVVQVTQALELVFLMLAAVAIAGVLLLVAMFATRRAAEEDDLDRDFPRA